jgi:hypothetical protein
MISVQANTPYNSQHPETWEGPLVLVLGLSPALHPRHRTDRVQCVREEQSSLHLLQSPGRNSDLTPPKSGPNGYNCDHAVPIRRNDNIADPTNPFPCRDKYRTAY